jgi:hypothetical protein
MRRALLIAAILVVLASASMGTSTAQQTSWVAYLSAGETAPRVNSQATGTAIFQMMPNGVAYWVYLNGITNVMMGHIHIGAPGVAGPVAVWLYPAAPPPVVIQGSYSGLVGQGTITAANFVGPLANQPMSALINAINAGNAYANFHTQANPGGEIRGQIR